MQWVEGFASELSIKEEKPKHADGVEASTISRMMKRLMALSFGTNTPDDSQCAHLTWRSPLVGGAAPGAGSNGKRRGGGVCNADAEDLFRSGVSWSLFRSAKAARGPLLTAAHKTSRFTVSVACTLHVHPHDLEQGLRGLAREEWQLDCSIIDHPIRCSLGARLLSLEYGRSSALHA